MQATSRLAVEQRLCDVLAFGARQIANRPSDQYDAIEAASIFGELALFITVRS
jgi:hypothetical protein